MQIEVVEEAQAQFDYREAWWRANRDARDLFEEEYEQALEHLSTSPKSGDQYSVVRGKLIRRWLMKKTGCHIYYWYSEELDLIEIRSFWGREARAWSRALRQPRAVARSCELLLLGALPRRR